MARAPAALRSAGLVDRLREAGIEIADRGDVAVRYAGPARDPASGLIAPEALALMIRAVAHEVSDAHAAAAFPLVLGGDCPILLGCLGRTGSGSPPGLVFVDGHEDAWPPRMSSTGEAADMELGFALGLTLDDLPSDLRDVMPSLDPDRVVVIGPRDQAELAEAGVASIGSRVEVVAPELIEDDAESILGDAVARHGLDADWWFHVDLDVLSTASLGSVDYPQAGGLDWSALTQLSRAALDGRGAIGWDVTIYNPDLDRTGADADRIVRYIVETLTP